ncbi:MAG TPA: nucleoside recognition domain-containing protein [Bacteroidales bacterium]|nr:nucleoside recognition domain-containing protein [Bacteroidales bacterium]
MVLNYIWIGLIVVGFLFAFISSLITGNATVFPSMMNAAFEMAKTGFELSLGLTGVMTLWLGIMKVAEKSGMVQVLVKLVRPLFSRLFPEIPAKHPVHGSIMMNVAANMLGLDNAATPLGLKAMNELQELNPHKEKASNSQIMFMVLNASGLTIIPISIMVYRTQMGAANPADIFIPILIATFVATLTGIISVSIVQKINLLQRTILLYLGGFSFIVALLIWYFTSLPVEKLQSISTIASNFIILLVLVSFVFVGFIKKINVYDTFIEGAKDGFQVAVKIIPFLIAILVAIGIFRESGALPMLVEGVRKLVLLMGFNADFVDAIPTALMKPLSGSGARGMMIDTMKTFGVDSFAGRLSCVFQGATDTTFYIIAVYFGSVGIKNTRHAISCALIADLAGIIAAIFVSYLFFR